MQDWDVGHPGKGHGFRSCIQFHLTVAKRPDRPAFQFPGQNFPGIGFVCIFIRTCIMNGIISSSLFLLPFYPYIAGHTDITGFLHLL